MLIHYGYALVTLVNETKEENSFYAGFIQLGVVTTCLVEAYFFHCMHSFPRLRVSVSVPSFYLP